MMPDQDHKFRVQGNSLGHLLSLIGKAVWGIQNLEEVLNHFLAMYNTERHEREIADKKLAKYRKKTLGGSLKEIDKKRLLSDDLRDKLKKFLGERNWLIHRSYLENIDQLEEGVNPSDLIKRIESIAMQSQSLSAATEVEMMRHFESKGLNIKNIATQLVEKYGNEVTKQLYDLEV